MATLIGQYPFAVIPVASASAQRVARAYTLWGKGVHPAGVNLGDCFAYDVAKEHSCPLLFVGNDFSRTDIDSVL
jgi:ribonuclease VapC